MSGTGENSSKSNGFGTDPLQRLASFKAPRDLTLGGTKPTKKVFLPNLNVSRNKNRGPNTNIRENKNEDKGKRDRKNDRQRNNFRQGPKIVKSSGVFSEGLGGTEKHSSRVSYGRDTDTSQTTLQKPTIRTRDVIKLGRHSTELEDQQIKSLVDGGCDDNDGTGVDFKTIKEKNAPIKLPMDDGGAYHRKLKAAPPIQIKQEVVVKQEPREETDCSVIDIQQQAIPLKKEEEYENTDVVNILKSEEPTLLLLQLPDSLPGRGGGAEDEHPRRRDKHPPAPSTSSDTDTTDDKPQENRCLLTDLEEGRIGKLMIHRSGRVSVKLGETMFELCLGTKPAFHQEAVSLAASAESRSARLVALGALLHKLTLVPDWETMFADIAT